MTILTVVLPSFRPTVGTEFVYVLSEDGRTPQRQGVAALDLLPPARHLHLVVPAAQLSWFSLKLPPVAGGRLRMVLDGMLEERLLDEPANTALAIAPAADAQGVTLVAACDKAWLAAALVFFEQGQRPALRVLPEFAPTGSAGADHRLWVSSGAEHAWLTMLSPTDCLQLPLAQAPQLLAQAGGAWEAAPLWAQPEVAAEAESVLGRSAQVQPLAERLLATGEGAWELAQFDLAQTGRDRMARRWASGWRQFLQAPAWRPTRWALVLLVVLNLVGLNAWAWRQNQILVAKRAQVREVLTRTFPGVRTIVDAPVQMAREVALLRQASGGVSAVDLEVMLSALGAALPSPLAPTSLAFTNGELRAEGLALDPAQTTQVLARLSGAGLTARYDAGRLSVRAGAGP